MQKSPFSYLCIDDIVSRETILAHNHPVSAATEVAADPNSRADAGRESQGGALFSDPVVKLPDGGSSIHPRSGIFDIDGDRPEIEQIEDDEWDAREVRQTLVVVAPTPHPDLEVGLSRAVHRGLSLRHIHGGDDD